MSSNFGGKPKDPMPSSHTDTNKMLLFSTLIVGTVIFMGYRAAIISELSTEVKQYPFNSLESLLASDYL